MISKMEESDIAGVVAQGPTFFAETYYGDKSSYDAKTAEQMVRMLVTEPNGIALIDRGTGAFFLGAIEKHWFCDMYYAFDFCVYVPKHKRGGGTGYRLLRAYMEQAIEMGVGEIMLGDIAGIDTELLHKMHDKLGFTARSKQYSKLVGE